MNKYKNLYIRKIPGNSRGNLEGLKRKDTKTDEDTKNKLRRIKVIFLNDGKETYC